MKNFCLFAVLVVVSLQIASIIADPGLPAACGVSVILLLDE
jgi:hypothetical protein